MSYTYAQAASGVGNNVAIDTIGGTIFQRMKLDLGGEGASVPASGTAQNGLMVDVVRIQSPMSVTQSGTWTVAQGSPPWSVSQSGSWNVGQSGAPWLMNVQNTAAVSGTVTANQGGAPWSVSQSGTWNVNASQSGTPWLVNIQNTAAVSGTVTANQGGAPWSVSQSGTWNVGLSTGSNLIGLVNINNTAAVSGTVAVTQSTSPWACNVSHVGGTTVAVDIGNSSNATQRVVLANNQPTLPVSGTVTSNQGNAPWTVNVQNTAAVSGTVSAIPLVAGAAITTMISTELNSLTTTSITTPATAFDNTTTGYGYADFELLVTYGTNPTAGSQVELYLVPALDGTNYADGSSSVVSSNHYVGGFVLRAVTTAQRIVLRNISIPACPFKVHVKNSSGQTTAASGNTVRMMVMKR